MTATEAGRGVGLDAAPLRFESDAWRAEILPPTRQDPVRSPTMRSIAPELRHRIEPILGRVQRGHGEELGIDIASQPARARRLDGRGIR